MLLHTCSELNYLVTIKNRINNADNITILRKQTKKTADAFTHLQQNNLKQQYS